MGNVLIKEETMTQIADAIREKAGSSDLYKPYEMPEAILEISTYSGESIDPNKPIRFYDPYGELVYSYTMKEVEELKELPPLPEIKGLIGQEWNWTLESILEEGGEIEVGSLYITDDGSTRIYVELHEGALNPKIGFKQKVSHSVKIDWGDGSAIETSDVNGGGVVSIEHQYAVPGKYVIRLIPDEGRTLELFGYTYSSVILHKEPSSSYANLVYANTIQKVELGRGVQELGDYAFSSYRIKSVTIPKEVMKYNRAFGMCRSLEYLVMTRAVSNITTSAFDKCSSLRRVSFSETLVFLGQYSFYDCGQLQQIYLTSKTRVGNGYIFSNAKSVKKIVVNDCAGVGENEFGGCSGVEKIILVGTALWEISGSAFRSCELLKEIELPECVVRIKPYAFSHCYALQKLKIPTGVTVISSNLCYNAYTLQEITVPSRVTSIENYAFFGCKGIENYYLLPTIPPALASKNAFEVSSKTKIHVPKGSLEAYQTADVWSELATYMVEMEE